MTNNTQKGNDGEDIATAYLINSGYKIIAKNWRHKHLEIDIIATVNNTLVIVEVKLRTSQLFGTPEEFVTKSKQKKLIKAADFFIKENDISTDTRFDVISIIHNQYERSINPIQNAFYPTI